MNVLKLFSRIAIASCLFLSVMNGCTKAPAKQDTSKLEDAKTAAEDAEKKLYDLKQERLKLEAGQPAGDQTQAAPAAANPAPAPAPAPAAVAAPAAADTTKKIAK